MAGKNKFVNQKFLFPILMVFSLVILCILCAPLIRFMSTEDFRQQLAQWVDAMGGWGIAALLALQILQIVVAFIPGEPVEIVAGSMYGALGGLAVCLLGILIGSYGIFTLVRKKGKVILERSGYADAIHRYDFIHNEQKLETIIFLLYFIPGTPKDILIYVCALTEIPPRRFLLLSTMARIPSIVTSTLAGASFASGNLGLMAGIFAATALIGLVGIRYHDRLLHSKKSD